MAWPKNFDPTPRPPRGWNADGLKLPRRWLKHLSPRRDLPSGQLPIPDHVPEAGAKVTELYFREFQANALESPAHAARLWTCARANRNASVGFGDRLADWFVYERGLLFALEAALLVPGEYAGHHAVPNKLRLRYHLAHADDATWDSARQLGEAERDSQDTATQAGLGRRGDLTYLFASHRPWVLEDLVSVEPPAKGHQVSRLALNLISCIWEPAQFESLKPFVRNVPPYLPDLMHQFGRELEPWLREMLSDHYVQIYQRYTKDLRAALDLIAPTTTSGGVQLPGYVDLAALAKVAGGRSTISWSR